MAITISPATETASYTIDLLRDTTTGDVFVALTTAVFTDFPDTIDEHGTRWQADQACIGQTITAIAGPLDMAEVAYITANPQDWDEDREFDLDAINALVEARSLVYEQELSSSN